MNRSQDPHKELLLAFARESVSAARNRLYAALAEKAGEAATAGLLHAMADSEEVRARRIMMHLRGKIGGEIEAHLEALISVKQKAFTIEFFRIAEMLRREGRETAAEAFEQFGEAAKTQFGLLNRRRRDLSATGETFYVCQVCGYIAVDAPPKNCPICHAVATKFKKRDQPA